MQSWDYYRWQNPSISFAMHISKYPGIPVVNLEDNFRSVLSANNKEFRATLNAWILLLYWVYHFAKFIFITLNLIQSFSLGNSVYEVGL